MVRKIFDEVLEVYNIDHKPMTLVLFEMALEHLCRVYGHLLSKSEAMPVGGDGRGRFIEPEALAAEEERHWYSHFSMLKRNFAVL